MKMTHRSGKLDQRSGLHLMKNAATMNLQRDFANAEHGGRLLIEIALEQQG